MIPSSTRLRDTEAPRKGLIEGDLDGEGDAGAVLNQDGERLHADVVNGGRLGAPIAESILDLSRGGSKAKAQLAQVKSRAGGDEEGEAEELHGVGVGVELRIQRRLDTVNPG